eukprot:1193938-Prorocentrum_minimum.AAC.3
MAAQNIHVAGTNRRRGERIYPYRAPIAEGEREYTRSGHQSQKGRENIHRAPIAEGERDIPVPGTNPAASCSGAQCRHAQLTDSERKRAMAGRS